MEECVMTLQEEGEKALLQGDQKGVDLLEKAAKLDPSSPHLFYRQGLALFEFGSSQNCVSTLRKGAQKFHQATTLNPQLCEAWQAWANTLTLLAFLTGKQSDLIEARDKIEKATVLVETLGEKMVSAEVYWDAALIYQKLAQASGEIDDLFKAVANFEKSSATNQTMPHEFWNDFGKTYSNLAERLHDIRPVLKSIACYKQAITLSLSNFEGWMGLGQSLKKLYYFSHENEHYLQACDCFAAASQLRAQIPEVWLERIEFIIESSRRKKESAKLRVAIEKCQQAMAYFAPSLKADTIDDSNNSVDPTSKPSTAYIYLLGYWAEALALLGSWTNRSELIQEAETKIDEALDASEKEDIHLSNQYGRCLYAFAQYYRDLDLYYQAIEEFQSSLSINRAQLTCWAWMGATYAKVYEGTDNDIEALEQAIYFYNKALQIKAHPHFYYEIAALLIQLAELQRSSDYIDQAINYLEYLLQTYKTIAFDHPEWFYQYGVALDIQGDIKDEPSLHHKALETLVNALMLDPTYPQIHHRIGIVYCHLGESLGEPDYLSQLEDEALLIDWGLAWTHLAQQATDSSMEESCFREAEQKLIQAARLGSQLAYYQLACLYSLQESLDLSLLYLHKSYASKNLPPLEELMEDDWLERLRLSPQFQEFLALLQKSC
jgi:hypothetical protein